MEKSKSRQDWLIHRAGPGLRTVETIRRRNADGSFLLSDAQCERLLKVYINRQVSEIIECLKARGLIPQKQELQDE